MIWLLVGLAVAAPLRFTPSSGAVVEVLPVTVSGRVELVIHGNSVDLHPQVGDASVDGVKSLRLLDMGAVWLLTLTMRDPETTIALSRVGDTLTASLAPARPLPPGDGGACDAAPRSPLVPLHTRDLLGAFSSELVAPIMPRWDEAELGDPTWEYAAELRRTLDPADARGHYALGALHRDLGHAREAAYYFSAASRLGAPGPIAVLQRAGVQLVVHDLVGAAQSAAEARTLGADEEVLAQIEGIVALMASGDDPASSGRVLASASGRARSAIVAAALLLRGGCSTEASAVLQRAVNDPDDVLATLALRLLVDARILLGDVAGAEAALAALSERGTPPTLAPLLRSRASLLTLLKQSPDGWAVMVPTLDRIGRGTGEEAAEALFLLAQISETLGDPRLSIYAWTTLVDRDRAFLNGEPGRRLARAWQARVKGLLHEGREMDALAVHAGVWRPGLIDHLQEPSALHDLASAAERLSLYSPALDLLRTASEVEGRRGLDDRASILTIARLYRLSGRIPEAEQSLDLLATRPPDPILADGMTLLRAAMQEDLGNDDAAWALYVSIRPPRPLAGEAALRRAMIDAHNGRCVDALPVFAWPPDPFPAGMSLSEMNEDEARCLLATGHPDDARVKAAQAAALLVNPDAVGFAAWTAGAPSIQGDIWSRVHGEDAAQATFTARVDVSRGSKPSSPEAPDR